MRVTRQAKLTQRASKKRAKRTAMHKVPPNKKRNPILVMNIGWGGDVQKPEWEKFFTIEEIKGRRAYIDPNMYSLISKVDGKVMSTHMTYSIAVKYAEYYIRAMENIILGK